MERIMEFFFLVLLLGWEALKWTDTRWHIGKDPK